MWIFLACASEPCGDGMGRADDGKCYPLAIGDTGTDQQTDTSDGTTNDSGTNTGNTDDTSTTNVDPGVPITVNGTLTVAASIQETGICSVSAWDAAHLLQEGTPDHNYQPFSSVNVTCPAGDGASTTYSASLTLNGHTDIAIIGFVDPDGTPDTPGDASEGGSDSNPLDATPGVTYNDINISL